MEPRTVRIFISSPGDVAEERQKAHQVIAELGRRYADRLAMKPILWEELPLMADMSFQQGIETILHAEGGIDIAVFILWSRLGSPLGKALRKPDGTEYRSGTEREWELMLAAREESAKQGPPEEARPKILAYVRNDVAGFTQSLQSMTGDSLENAFRQFNLARQFVREQFHDAESGTNIGAYTEFGEPLTFAGRLRLHLRNLLDGLLPETGPRVWDREPYRGLERFDVEHATIFCGREREVCELDERFRTRAKAGCPFVLLVGASGSGKSSLARAGWLHYLLHENLDPSVQRWLPVILTPAEAQGNLTGRLARGLADVLPGLREEEGLEALVRALRESPQQAWDLSIRRAFRDADPQGRTRLVLVLDQLEELFTDPAITAAEADGFLRAVGVLVRTGNLWCLATVRSDFYDRCLLTPALVQLMQGDQGQMNLLPPDAGALQRIITLPASFAGVRFETAASGETLDARILADTAAHPEALPLLEYLLRELYEERSGDGKLTLAHYDALGGVEGALRRRADKVFAAQDPARQAALPDLLNALVTIADGDKAVPVRRRAPLDELPEGPCRELAQALVNERLLVSDRGEISVAHEALLRCWERAAAWIAENREALRIRARVAQAAGRWQTEGQADDFLLPPGKPLAEAVALWTTRPRMLSPDLQDYVRRSQQRHLQTERRKRRRLQITAAVLAALTLIAASAAVFSVTQWRLAKQNAKRADDNAKQAQERAAAELTAKKLAQKNADTAQRNADTADRNADAARKAKTLAQANAAAATKAQKLAEANATRAQHQLALSYIDRGIDELEHGDPAHGFAVLGQAHRAADDAKDGGLRRNVCSLLGAWQSTTGHRLAHDNAVAALAFSPDGTKIVTASYDHTARLWDAATGKPLGDPIKHDGWVRAVAFSPDGTKLATASDDKTARLWDAATGKPLGQPMKHYDAVRAVAFSPDATKVATASLDKTARLWDSATGKPLGEPMKHDGCVEAVAFSPDGTKVATASADHTARLWDTATCKLLGEPLKHDDAVQAVAFDPDGTKVATASDDKTARLWDAATCKPLGEPMKHDDWVVAVAFSPDGTKLATASDDTAQLWDAATGKPLGVPMKHDGPVRAVAFSPDGTKVATASWHATEHKDEARLWDAATGKPLGEPMKHDDLVAAVVFSPDGTKVATASYDTTARLWDAATGKPLGTPMRHDGWVVAVAFSPDGTKRATASPDKTARLWDAATCKPLGEPMKHDSGVWAVAFSPDGTTVATASEDKTARLWDAATGKPLGEPMKHDDKVVAVAFSPDGTKVATASADHTARLWDAATGEPLGEPMRHDGNVLAVAFSPDGTKVATASLDKTARLWPVSRLLPDDPRWVTDYVQVVSAWKEDADGALHPISAAQQREAWQEVLKSPAWLDQDRQLNAKLVHTWHEIEARDDEAAKRWFAAAFHFKCLVASDPGDAQWQRELSRCYKELGNASLQQGQPEAAQKYFRDSEAIAKKLTSKPSPP